MMRKMINTGKKGTAQESSDAPMPTQVEVVKRASPGSSSGDRGTIVMEGEATESSLTFGPEVVEKTPEQRRKEKKMQEKTFRRRGSIKRTPLLRRCEREEIKKSEEEKTTAVAKDQEDMEKYNIEKTTKQMDLS
ncbi:hypothetical protein FQA39_LY14105 [Lamprigera yunnana]|nr:hypothetical protein FQA39_LY14105 [Lamprigera yunnana]